MKAKSEENILGQILKELSPLDNEARLRIINSVKALYGLNGRPQPVSESGHSKPSGGNNGRDPVFSNHKDIDAKTFITRKKPKTNVERIACLAYYLAHYQGIRHFKTINITELNTEAAQNEISNTAGTIINALQGGYLAPATKGFKKISAFGEQYVDALPDRQSARSIMAKSRSRRTKHKKKSTNKK